MARKIGWKRVTKVELWTNSASSKTDTDNLVRGIFHPYRRRLLNIQIRNANIQNHFHTNSASPPEKKMGFYGKSEWEIGTELELWTNSDSSDTEDLAHGIFHSSLWRLLNIQIRNADIQKHFYTNSASLPEKKMGLDAKSEKLWKEFQMEVPRWTKKATKSIVELRSIADAIDNYHQGATIANIAGSSTGAVGGMLTIAGTVAAPFTMGTSLVLTGVGLGAGIVGGVTNIVSNYADNANQTSHQKRVDVIVEKYIKMTKHLTDTLTQLNQAIEYLIQSEERKNPASAFVNTAQGLAKGLGLASALTTTLTRNAMITFRAVSGVLAGLTIAWDVFSIIKDVYKLGKKVTEISKMIRQIATNMEEERGTFAKTLSDLKKCDQLNNHLVG